MNWPADLPVIDAHHHLWKLGRGIDYPMLDDPEGHAFFLGDFQALRRDVLPQDYRRAAIGIPIVHTVAVEAECSAGQKVKEARWLDEVGGRERMPSVVVAGALFEHSDVDATLAQLAQVPTVRSVRCKPRTKRAPNAALDAVAGSLADPAWVRGFRQLQAHGLAWDLRVPYWHLEEAAALVAAHPGIPVVVEHAGLPLNRDADAIGTWRRGMRSLAESAHVFCKLSCLLQPGRPWDRQSNERIVLEVIEMFGPGRCMFASNYPVDALQIPMAEMLEAYRQMTKPLGLAAQQQVFHDSAATFYGIETP